MDTAAQIEAQRARLPALDDAGKGLLFTQGHTHNSWQDRPVDDATIAQALDLAGLGPTAFNQQPLRVLVIRSDDAKARLVPAMSEMNRAKTQAAPATLVLCADLDFAENLPELWPAKDVRGVYADPANARASAHLNAGLQAGYLIMALRAMGLDCGPMAGFSKPAVTEAFLQGKHWDILFCVNIGHGDPATVRPRLPRLGHQRMSKTL